VNIVKAVKFILGLVLLFSGISKILDPGKAVYLMIELKIIPEDLILIIISILLVLEILIGVFLVSGMYHKFATIIRVISIKCQRVNSLIISALSGNIRKSSARPASVKSAKSKPGATVQPTRVKSGEVPISSAEYVEAPNQEPSGITA